MHQLMVLKAVNWMLWVFAGILVLVIRRSLGWGSFLAIYDQLPPGPKEFCTFAFFALAAVGFIQINYGVVIRMQYAVMLQPDPILHLTKVARLQVVVAVLEISNILVVPVYSLGFTTMVRDFVSSHAPVLGTTTAAAVSFALTAIISGLLGNFAYELVKRGAVRLVPRRKQHERAS